MESQTRTVILLEDLIDVEDSPLEDAIQAFVDSVAAADAADIAAAYYASAPRASVRHETRAAK